MSDADRYRVRRVARAGARRLVAAAAVVAAAFASGCQPPEQKAADALESAASWAATAEMVARSWLDGRLPVVYARQTLDAAEQAMHATDDALRREDLPAGLRATISAELRDRVAAVEVTRSAVERGDSAAVRSQAGLLAAGADALAALAQRVSGSGSTR